MTDPNCSMCDGTGYVVDYDDKWPCRACNAIDIECVHDLPFDEECEEEDCSCDCEGCVDNGPQL